MKYIVVRSKSGAAHAFKYTPKKRAKNKKASVGEEMRVFIGDPNYASVGGWIDLPIEGDFNDNEQYNEAIDNIKALAEEETGNFDAEYIIADWEGLPKGDWTYSNLGEVNDVATAILEAIEESYLPEEIIEAIFDDYSNYEDAVDAIGNGDIFYIEADDDAELAERYIDELGGIEILSKNELERYFDYDAYGRELAFDFTQTDGYYYMVR